MLITRPFLNEKYPDVKLAHDLERKLVIDNIATSGAFASTHKIIAELSKYPSFTAVERNDILRNSLSNNQVYWLFTDDDVYVFMISLIEGHETEIDSALLSEAKALLIAATEVRAKRDKDKIAF